MKTIESRFWAKVNKEGPDDCWDWQGGKNNKGYGYFWVEGKIITRVHRFAYQLLKGNIPKTMTLDHLCRNRSCVNPNHLEVVTMRINSLRGVGASARNARATHCPKGHPYDLLNTHFYVNGNRRCQTCNREYRRQHYALKYSNGARWPREEKKRLMAKTDIHLRQAKDLLGARPVHGDQLGH